MSPLGIAIGAAAWASSCSQGPTEQPALALEIGVEADSEIPLRDVPVYVGRDRLGNADSGSTIRALISDPPGTKLLVWCECPPGFEPPKPASSFVVRRYRSDQRVPEVKMTLRCRPKQRAAAFVVRAEGGPSVDIFLEGTRVATTDANGVAHFWTSASPGSEHQVELRASADRRLRPQRVSHFFTLQDEDSVFVVQQVFKRETPAKSKRKRHRILKIE